MQPLKAQPITGLFATFKNIFTDTLDLVFPPRCLHCGRVDEMWCDECLATLTHYPLTLKERSVPPLTGIVATGVHDDILKSGIQAFKYYQQADLARVLGQRLATVLAQTQWTIDMIVPVPLHTLRLKKRGYNQSKYLGDIVSERMNIPIVADALIRERETRPQVGLNRAERLVNVADAFFATPQVEGLSLLIVDDVVTTGSTLSACAQAALTGGAKDVYAITLAVAQD